MSDKLTSRSKFQPLFPGDRATAPSALELDNPSAWALFEQGQRRGETQFQETVASTHAATLPAALDAGTEAQTLADALPTEPVQLPDAVPALSLDDVLALARRRNRACPRPEYWMALTAALRSEPPPEGLPPLPSPMTGGGSAMQKRLRLRDQAEWAEAAGPATLQRMHDVLAALPEENWLHFDED